MISERKMFESQEFIKRLLGYSKFDENRNEYVYFRFENYAIRDTCELNTAWKAWQASANREGYKLVPVNDINIADMIWGKCSCGSSRSPIVSDREGYNLIHCFACGANKYIHEDY